MKEKKALGDMPANELRKFGYESIDWLADYLENIDDYPVLPQVEPGDISAQLPESPPLDGEDMGSILEDFREIIIPGVTHWNHPAFMSYFSITGSGPGILGELLCAGLNVNAMLWKTCPSSTELEQTVMEWLRKLVGLPDDFWGISYDTASVSTMHAIAAAREMVPGLNARQNGLCGSGKKLRLYISDQTHSSVEKSAIILGIGLDGVRKIPSDSEFRMDTELLESAIKEDVTDGWTPFCIVATVGTTSTTSIDPIDRIADICRENGLWLHVDAAYGGMGAVLPEMKWVFDGCEKADSLVTNPHKWLFAPQEFSAFFCRHQDVLKQAFSLVPEYLKTEQDQVALNYMDYGIQLGRRMRALKMWFVLRYFGVSGIQSRIRQVIEWAGEMAGWIDDHPEFERIAPVPFSTVCFRVDPDAVNFPGDRVRALDEFNENLIRAVNDTGKVYLSHTRLNGRLAIRMALGNIRTERKHIEQVWEILKTELGRLKENMV
ncbi:MAG: aminotransferase class I/II-fold pyridoxal phosphate-dependent enzyme [Acidobacteriota bacterium]